MYKRVVQSCGAQPQESPQAPQTPREVQETIKGGGKGGSVNSAADIENNAANAGTGAAGLEKPMSHALRVFLENQARHERLSREIDVRNGLIFDEEQGE